MTEVNHTGSGLDDPRLLTPQHQMLDALERKQLVDPAKYVPYPDGTINVECGHLGYKFYLGGVGNKLGGGSDEVVGFSGTGRWGAQHDIVVVGSPREDQPTIVHLITSENGTVVYEVKAGEASVVDETLEIGQEYGGIFGGLDLEQLCVERVMALVHGPVGYSQEGANATAPNPLVVADTICFALMSGIIKPKGTLLAGFSIGDIWNSNLLDQQ